MNFNSKLILQWIPLANPSWKKHHVFHGWSSNHPSQIWTHIPECNLGSLRSYWRGLSQPSAWHPLACPFEQQGNSWAIVRPSLIKNCSIKYLSVSNNSFQWLSKNPLFDDFSRVHGPWTNIGQWNHPRDSRWSLSDGTSLGLFHVVEPEHNGAVHG